MNLKSQQLIATGDFFLVNNCHVAFLDSSLNLTQSSVLLLNNELKRLQSMCCISELSASAKHDFSELSLSHQTSCESM